MEYIYKIKVKSSADPRWLFPSERRYSASTVLGLGVVHLALATTAFLLACLTLTANDLLNNTLPSNSNNTNVLVKPLNMTEIKINSVQGDSTVNSDVYLENVTAINATEESNRNGFCITLTLSPCIMCLGSLSAGLTGILAWKRWYIDHNIKWFFCMSLLSTVTSTMCLIFIGILVIVSNENIYDIISVDYMGKFPKPSTKYILIINILIASILEWLWSILSTKVGFSGMKNNYPDDMVISKSRGKVQVNTIHKGNNKGKMVPPDLLNHFPGKLLKYLPKKSNENLPKEESNSEYQERVNKFLSSHVDINLNS